MATEGVNIQDRVRDYSPEEANERMDQKIVDRMNKYRDLTINEINSRLEKLGKAWDIERTLEVNASALALTGIILGTFGKKRWFILPFIVTGFLLQHGLQGWCPPLPLFRKLGIRTRQEITEEIYALKALRGDFDNISARTDPEEIVEVFRR
jgi:hypothetical protein